MVDLRALRQKIAEATDPKVTLRVTRDWLQEVERDLTELALLRSAAVPAATMPRARA